ncbi:MAG: hypothetical protein KA746_07115 [Pyrinomonadaceae bacterium]|nr:hypothetical protein [Pyrinomonadaceae bacterium]MBP6213931.1 hypothetical protein [Pyrinomonadaceae bacterium]
MITIETLIIFYMQFVIQRLSSNPSRAQRTNLSLIRVIRVYLRQKFGIDYSVTMKPINV